MSLFGNFNKGTPAAPSTGGSLFGNQQAATPANPTVGNSLFGQSQSQASTVVGGSTSLFGQQPAISSTAATTNATPQQGGLRSLLGGLPRPSVFSNTNTQNMAQQAAPGPNLAPGLGASVLGVSTTTNPAVNASQGQASVAYFDSLLAKNKKQAEGETALGELPSLQLGLGDLRQRLKQLGPRTGGDGAAQAGTAHSFLAASGVDPGAAVKDLRSFGLQTRERGIGATAGPAELDVDAYLSSLQTKTTLSMISDGLERSVRDFDNFMEDNVTMEWDAQRKRIYEHFGIKPREPDTGGVGTGRAGTPARDAQGGTGDFGRSRRKGASQATGERAAHRESLLGRSIQRSIIGTPSRIGSHPAEFADVEVRKDSTGVNANPSDRFLREKQAKLAEKIQNLNLARLRTQPFYIFDELKSVELTTGDKHVQEILYAYEAMMEVVGEMPDQEPPRERQFSSLYLDQVPHSQNSIAMRTRILRAIRSYLEKKFYSEVESLIAKYPQDANLGGRPDVVSKIKAYVRLKIARKTLVVSDLQVANGEYVWAILFFLLRAGYVNEAAQYVNVNEHQFRSIDRAFLGYINSYAASEDRRLRRQMQDRCANEYNQRIRNAPEGSIDPFRMACYKIIGRCDLANRVLDDRLGGNVTDWIWLQFALARESDRTTELAGESFGLAELQTTVRDIGAKHFPKTPAENANGNTFGMFFFLQLISGMYEHAIHYLYQFSYVDAVHFAIALSYYGLLRPADVSAPENELLSLSVRDTARINFGRMLGYYTMDFRAANAAAAVDYLVLICLNADETPAGQQQAQLCYDSLRGLVLDTKEFSKLIGDVRPDGHRIRGLIEERGPLIALNQEHDFIRAITMQAASSAEGGGRITDAVLLYHLAGDYDTVVSIVSRTLSEAISYEIGEDPMRLQPVKPRVEGREAATQPGSSLSLVAIDDPVELARTMMNMYEQDHMFWQNIRDQNRIACSVLLQISAIKELVGAGHWAQSLDVRLSCLGGVAIANKMFTGNQKARDSAAGGKRQPEYNPAVCVAVHEPGTARGYQRSAPNYVDDYLLHQAA